ncbi:MAG: VOC family protein [Pseudomonadota bacterium]|nr:VOC family protein [Pseudomonadota bacterium]
MAVAIGPDFVALQVRDLQASAIFYQHVLGFSPEVKSPPEAVLFKTSPIPLALRNPLRPLPSAGPLGLGLSLWIACDDADELHRDISDRGGTVLGAPVDGPFGRFFALQDPDGYVLTFHTNKSR